MKKDWKIKKLCEISEFRRGLTYKKSDEVTFSNNAVLRANNIDFTSSMLNLMDIRYINDDVKIPKNKKLVKGSVLICTASGSKKHLGKVAFVDEELEYAFGGFMGLLVPDQKIVYPRYLFKVLSSNFFREHLNSLTAGANINNLKFSQIENLEISFPESLEEQRRIVGVLDEKFAAIDELIKITEQQIANVNELFESRLSGIFSDKNGNWQTKKLGEVCEMIKRGSAPRYTESSDGVLVVNQKCIRNHIINLEFARKHDLNAKKILKERFVQIGDGLVNSTGTGTLGRVAQVRDLAEQFFVDTHVTILRPKKDLFHLNFFGWILIFIEDQIKAAGEGTSGQTELARTKLENDFVISFPESLEEQKRIVGVLDELSQKTKQLEEIYQQKLDDLKELKQSYLHEVFEGRL